VQLSRALARDWINAQPKVQVREFVVEAGQWIEWHYHSKITDWCFCLEGLVLLRRPASSIASMLVRPPFADIY